MRADLLLRNCSRESSRRGSVCGCSCLLSTLDSTSSASWTNMEAEHHMLHAATSVSVLKLCMSSDPHQISVQTSNTAICICGFNQANVTWLLATHCTYYHNSTSVMLEIFPDFLWKSHHNRRQSDFSSLLNEVK